MEECAVKTILIVDDEQRFLAVLATELRECSHDFCILTAENGDKALKILESAHVDLVLTDLKMPVMDGYELLRCMNKKYPNIPVIVMSFSLYPEVVTKLRDLGVSQCIEKPFSISLLKEMIAKRVEEKRGEEPVGLK
ncbi:MAG TPA: response regulator [Thermodesulfobacteriota bacterium]|nr:response regulator [Thermodesulfobacteriota bacterium]